MLTAKDNLRNRLLFIAWGGVKDFWCVTILNLHDTPPPPKGSRILLWSSPRWQSISFVLLPLYSVATTDPLRSSWKPCDSPPKKSTLLPPPQAINMIYIFYSIVTNFDFHWPVFPRLDSREYLCTWVTLQRGHLSRTLCISHRCVFYRLLGNWGDISKPVINRIGNHVHVLYRYIAIAGNRSRCSGSQSVAEVLAVSVVKVVGKEKNKL